jgi:hypothetical protein
MRTGLVLIGVCLLAVGVALAFLGTVNLPYGSSTQSTEPFSFALAGSSELALTIQGQNGSSSLKVSFSSSLPVEVWLTSCNPHQTLPPPCIIGYVPASTSGALSISQPQFPFFLVVNNQGASSANVSVIVHLSTTSTNGIGLWEDIVVFVGAGILLLGGAILLILGFFLQGNPYAEGGIPIDSEVGAEEADASPDSGKDDRDGRDKNEKTDDENQTTSEQK